MEPIPLMDWQRLSQALATCFDGAGDVTVDEHSFHFHSPADKVDTSFTMRSDGRVGASMPLHGLELVATHAVVDQDQRTVTVLGHNLRYTYRIPPSLLIP